MDREKAVLQERKKELQAKVAPPQADLGQAVAIARSQARTWARGGKRRSHIFKHEF